MWVLTVVLAQKITLLLLCVLLPMRSSSQKSKVPATFPDTAGTLTLTKCPFSSLFQSHCFPFPPLCSYCSIFLDIIWFLLISKRISFKWTLLLSIADLSEGLPLFQSLAEHLSNTHVNFRSRNLTCLI